MKRLLSIAILVLFLVGCAPSNIEEPVVQESITPKIYDDGSLSVSYFKENRDSLLRSTVEVRGIVSTVYNCYCPPGGDCGFCIPEFSLSDPDSSELIFAEFKTDKEFPDISSGDEVIVRGYFAEIPEFFDERVEFISLKKL